MTRIFLSQSRRARREKLKIYSGFFKPGLQGIDFNTAFSARDAFSFFHVSRWEEWYQDNKVRR
jgi:hypothetical protein